MVKALDAVTSVLLSLITLGLLNLAAIAKPLPFKIAQVNEDITLGPEQSVVNLTTRDGNATYRIIGGAVRGANLFHSFDEFSVMAGEAAIFENSTAIENIIGRVTGQRVSTIDGRLQAAGGANLFLLNPAGVVIGPNARLDIGGSFLASTGEGLRFENGFVYSANATDRPPLLTVSAPIGLLMGSAPGRLQAVGADLAVPEGRTLALVGGEVAIASSQLTAPAGRIEILGMGEDEESRLAFGAGLGITPDPAAAYRDITLSGQSVIDGSGSGGGAIALYGQDITLIEQSAVISDTLGTLGGQGIQVRGDRVRLQEGAYIGSATLGSGAASSIDVSASQAIELIGTDIANFKRVEFAILLGARQVSDRTIGGITAVTAASGRAGDISLTAPFIQLEEGFFVSTESLGTGDGGNINIIAPKSLRLIGSGILAGSRVLGIPLSTPDGAATGRSTIGRPAGVGGIVEINTAQLSVENGSSILSGTFSDQDSGNVSIIATESVVLRGPFTPFALPTSIMTISLGGRGAAGDLQIKTGRLLVQDGAIVLADSGARSFVGNIEFGGSAGNIRIEAAESVDVVGGAPLLAVFATSTLRSRTFSEAPAGTIQITTPQLNIRDGGRITSETQNDGMGGEINIDAQSVVVSGAGNDIDAMSGIFANSGVEKQVAFTTGFIESVPADGNGGSITINADNLVVQDTAVITVSSFGSGAAGNLNIAADTVRLAQEGSLTAATTSDGGGNIALTANTLALDDSRITASSESGDGGNLSLNLQDVLLLNNGSLISTEAGTSGAEGDGGSIIFEGGIVLAVPDQNNDIIANAVAGQGGRIVLTTQNILGFDTSSGLTTNRLRNNQSNDISASSEFGRPGEVQIFNQVDSPVQAVVTLPTDLLRAEQTIGPSVCTTGRGNHFAATGRSGVPLAPQDLLTGAVVWIDEIEDWADGFRDSVDDLPTEPLATNHLEAEGRQPSSPAVVEAQGWRRLADGRVALTSPDVQAAIAPTAPTC